MARVVALNSQPVLFVINIFLWDANPVSWCPYNKSQQM